MGLPGPDELSFPSHPRPLAAKRVLIVEDDADGADSMAFLLMHHGHEVRVARTAEEACREVDRFRPQVVLLDVQLRRGQTGYDVARYLRRSLGPLPLVMAITGCEGMEERSRAEGIDHHFVKPVEIGRVLSLVAAA